MKTVQKKIADPKNKAFARAEEKSKGIAYRLKCERTANGLSHFVMYGDVPKEKTLV